MHNSDIGGNQGQVILRQAIDSAIESLGGPIHKTITWYMDSRGVFSDPKKIDINFFYSNLQELLGPGADLIMEETWEQMQKRRGTLIRNGDNNGGRCSPLERIQKIMEIGEA